MQVVCAPMVRLDGHFLHLTMQPEPNQGNRTEWLISLEAARSLCEAMRPFLDDETEGA